MTSSGIGSAWSHVHYVFFFFLLVFSFKKQLDCYGNAKLNVSKPGDDTIRKYSPTTLPSVFPQRIFVGFPVFLLPQKPFSHGHQSFQVNLAYIIIFLIERSYRYLGKVAWRMIAAAKASAPPLDQWCIWQSQNLFFRCSFYLYAVNEYEKVLSR